jgi:hypothetical protein
MRRSAAEIFPKAPTSLNPKLKNFSKESHYDALVSRALHGFWCRNPELDAVDRLHFCFVESIFQNQKIKSNKLFSALQKSKISISKKMKGYNRGESHKTDVW